MGHYIKITGRGYLKNLRLTKCVEYQCKFSKQLTLAYCADSKSDAESYLKQVILKVQEEKNLIEQVYNTGLKIITFPEMFNDKKSVLTFINKNVDKDIDKKLGSGNWSGFYSYITQYFNNNTWRPSKTVQDAINKFTNNYDGFQGIERAYKSISTTLKLVNKAKTVELDNYNVTMSNNSIVKPHWKKSMKSSNDTSEKYAHKIYCTCCGASIPGAKYLSIGVNICPYCLVKLSETAKHDVDRLGAEMAKAYKTALFVKNL